MCERTAEFIGMSGVKGVIKAGADADFVIWDPDEEFKLTEDMIQFKNKITPYEGKIFKGSIYSTWLRGEVIYSDNGFAKTPLGKTLLRK